MLLTLQPISAAAFAPYGWLADADGATGRPINDGSSQRIDGVGDLQLTAEAGAPCLALFRAQPRDPRGPWQQLERHRLGTQTFVPMGGARYVVLVALGDAAARRAHAGRLCGGRPPGRDLARRHLAPRADRAGGRRLRDHRTPGRCRGLRTGDPGRRGDAGPGRRRYSAIVSACTALTGRCLAAAARTFSQALAAPQTPMIAMPIQPQPSGTTPNTM